MSEAVRISARYDKRRLIASPITMFGLAPQNAAVMACSMLAASELLALLEARGITRADIGRVLKLPSSRISEMYNGRRRLQLDEAKKLVEAFRVDESAEPLSVPIARLLVLYAAEALEAPLSPDDRRVEELARDFRAFSEFATDPRVRSSQEAVAAFFQGLRLAPGRTTESLA